MVISEQLKAQTQPLHSRTEEKFRSSKIFTGEFTVADYQQLLLANYSLLQRFEDEVFSLIPSEAASKINLSDRRKLPLIIKDLEQTGTPLPVAGMAPPAEEAAEAWGILYVMEGSTLGGNMIAKQLSKLSAFEGLDFNFFRCYGSHTGFFWKNFKETLNREITPAQHKACLSGAQKAYGFLLGLPD